MSKLQAAELKALSEVEVVKKMGPLFTADQKKSGILASVSMAQFILESGYGKTELAQGANNCFGMKRNLSNNTWSGSTWDGKSVYTKKTQEDDGRGNLYTITADFRKYTCVEDSIGDHSAYLLGAMNGSKARYNGLKGEKDYKKAIQIIKDGGYATDTKYVAKICGIIERWNLTQFDVKEAKVENSERKSAALFTDRPVHDITAANLSEVPARRGSNKIEFIVIHYLGVPNADNPYLYGGGYGGHYNIQRDGSVYKAADPKTAVVWHCGGGLQGSGGHSFHGVCGNYNSIGIECGVCYTDTSVKDASGDSSKWYFTTETQESLVWLVAKLMKEYGISIDHVIRHYDVTGKICPNPYVKNNKLRTSWTWDEFKAKLAQQVNGQAAETKYYRVRKSWSDKDSQIGAFTVLANARLCVDMHPGYTAFDEDGKQVYPGQASFAEKFIASCDHVVTMARKEGWKYGDSHAVPPCSDKTISCDRLIARALYDLGLSDQRTGGETCGTLDAYLTSHGFTKVIKKKNIKSGAVIAVRKTSHSYIDHVFVVASYDKASDTCEKYDMGSNERIRASQPVTAKLVEWDDRVFVAAYNPPEEKRTAYPKYALTNAQLKKIARLCQQEQGSVAGAKAEASLMANQLETDAARRKKYGTGASGLYKWVRNGGWFSKAAYWMDNGTVSKAVLEGVRDVLVNGNRTLPLYIDEHDCISDIKSISTGDKKDRADYIQGKTVIKNSHGSTYTFWCFPDKNSDPFGYTAEAYKAAKG